MSKRLLLRFLEADKGGGTGTIEKTVEKTPSQVEGMIEEVQKAARGRPQPKTKSLTDLMQTFAGVPSPDGSGKIDRPVKTGESIASDTGEEGKEKLEEGEISQIAPTPVKPSERKPESQLEGKKPSYVKSLEQQLAERDAKLAALQTERDELDTKLKGLSEQIGTAKTQAEIDALVAEKDKALSDYTARLTEKDGIVNQMQARLNYYDLQEDPTFRQEYVAPLEAIGKKAIEMVGNEPTKVNGLHHIGQITKAWVEATTPEQRVALADQRDTAIEDLAQQLPSIRRPSFIKSMLDMADLAEKRHQALINHIPIKKQIDEKRRQTLEESQRRSEQEWSGAFEESATTLKQATDIDTEMEEYMKANDIAIDTSLDEAIARSAIKVGDRTYPAKEITRILNQGAKFSVLTAKIKALELQNKELRSKGEKRQASNTTGGGTGGKTNPTDAYEEKKKATFAVFAPPAGMK